MLLAVDVGNTRIQWGVYQKDELKYHWATGTDRNATEDELAVLLRGLFRTQGLSFEDITDVAIASSVPPLMPTFEKLVQRYLGTRPLIVGPGIKMGMPIRYDNPREVGADRIVVAIAAFERYGGPVVVVDFGTALLFDCISAKGEYLGVAGAPGVEISTEALFQRAAKLPRIELIKPPSVLGTNPIHSMQSGIIYGFAGQVDEVVKRIKAELGNDARVVATGDLAELIASETKTIQTVDPWLTLEGLRIVYERNRGS